MVPREQQVILILLLTGLLCLMAGIVREHPRLITGDPRSSNGPTESYVFLLDLNSVEVSDLSLLPGIGEKLGERIVDFRRQNGAYHRVDDLLNVNGIGPAKLGAMRPFITVQEAADRKEGEQDPLKKIGIIQKQGSTQ